jgi:hypothetical protein
VISQSSHKSCWRNGCFRKASVPTLWLMIFFIYTSWSFSTYRCTCTGLLLHLITLNDTTQKSWLLCTRDRSIAGTSTWQHTTLTGQTPIASARFEPAIPASERQQIKRLDRAATRIGGLTGTRIYILWAMYWCYMTYRRISTNVLHAGSEAAL